MPYQFPLHMARYTLEIRVKILTLKVTYFNNYMKKIAKEYYFLSLCQIINSFPYVVAQLIFHSMVLDIETCMPDLQKMSV